MMMGELVFAIAGVTDSQLPPSVVVTLVTNETAAYAGGGTVVNTTFCDKRAVEPSGAEGVQAGGLGVTRGGAVPVAVSVGPFTSAKMPVEVPLTTRVTVPEIKPTIDGIPAGTAVIMKPSGMVTLPEISASPPRLQLLRLIVSGAPTLSVSVTVAGGVDGLSQVRPATATVTPL